MREICRLLAASIVALVLAGCGGGGSGGGTASSADSGTSVRFNPNPIVYSSEAGAGSTVLVTAYLSPPPSGTLYAVVRADKPGFAPGAVQVTSNADGSYSTFLPIDEQLAAGFYTGTLTLQLCLDSQCKTQLALDDATLPYSLTLVPPVIATVLRNGVPQIASPFAFKTGDTVSVSSNIPVAWAPSPSSGLTVSSVTSTTTTWSGTFTGTGSLSLLVSSTQVPWNKRTLVFQVSQ